jgi:hypothetical protein
VVTSSPQTGGWSSAPPEFRVGRIRTPEGHRRASQGNAARGIPDANRVRENALKTLGFYCVFIDFLLSKFSEGNYFFLRLCNYDISTEKAYVIYYRTKFKEVKICKKVIVA